MLFRSAISAAIRHLAAYSLRFPMLSALLLGCLFPLGFAPFQIWPSAILSMAGFYALLHHRRQQPHSGFKSLFNLSLSYCVGLFSVGISWIHVSIYVYGESPLIISLLLTGAMIAVMSVFVSLVMAACCRYRLDAPLSPLLFATLWVMGEMVRSLVLTGFPWLLLGYSLIDSPLVGFAPVVGVYGLSFIAALGSAWLARLFLKPAISNTYPEQENLGQEENRARVGYAIALLLLFGCGYGLQQQHWTTPLPQMIDVALIQGNIDQRIKWDESEQQNTLTLYRRLTTQWLHSPREKSPNTTLVVWPEAAVPMFYHEAQAYLQQMSKALAAANVSWITGVPTQEGDPFDAQYFNSIIAAGQGSGRYNKQKLVPFGEFIPFPETIRTLGRALQWPIFDLPMSSFSVGTPQQAPLMAGPYRIAPFICYEIVYPDLVRRTAAQSDVLLTISNDGWFGHSVAPHQHFEMSRMRAIETGKMLIRATNTGISGLIDHRGQVIMQMPSFQRLYGTGQVQVTTGQTPFMRMGNLPIYTSIVLLLLFYGVGSFDGFGLRRLRQAQSPGEAHRAQGETRQRAGQRKQALTEKIHP
jgi:apolipoprotein N-acyltransferase